MRACVRWGEGQRATDNVLLCVSCLLFGTRAAAVNNLAVCGINRTVVWFVCVRRSMAWCSTRNRFCLSSSMMVLVLVVISSTRFAVESWLLHAL